MDKEIVPFCPNCHRPLDKHDFYTITPKEKNYEFSMVCLMFEADTNEKMMILDHLNLLQTHISISANDLYQEVNNYITFSCEYTLVRVKGNGLKCPDTSKCTGCEIKPESYIQLKTFDT